MSAKEKKGTAKKSTKKTVSSEQDHYGLKEQPLEFFSSGCTLWDLSLGGGNAVGRIHNICGAHSSSKTGSAGETIKGFCAKYPEGEGLVAYLEAENAYEKPYARRCGIPIERIHFVNEDDDFVNTVECMHDKVLAFAELLKKKGVPGIFVVDSLDALSSEAELNRSIRDKTFGGDKAKKMSEFYRRMTKIMSDSNMHFYLISQLRAKIGVTFGEKEGKTGGKSVDYYNTHVTKLKYLGKIKQTKKGFEKVIGIELRAVNRKNKVNTPFLDVEFPSYEKYGIHNTEANLRWLYKMEWGSASALDALGIPELTVGSVKEVKKKKEILRTSKDVKTFITKKSRKLMVEADPDFEKLVDDHVRVVWKDTMALFEPTVTKYIPKG